ncbi:hypothetical protein ACQKP8_26900 [Photobacterium alginatilyticum]|uniref:hypothetical protein n=1 Tax=Photobacterium swingsii TaxID=680026 RepID=UPI004067FA66
MKFPAVIVFSDNSFSVVNSIDSLQKEPEWAMAQSSVSDILIDHDGMFYRVCARSDVEAFTDGLADTVVFEEIDVDKDKQQEIINTLSKNDDYSKSERVTIIEISNSIMKFD